MAVLPLTFRDREHLRMAINNRPSSDHIIRAINGGAAGETSGGTGPAGGALGFQLGAADGIVFLDSSDGGLLVIMPKITTVPRRIVLRHARGPYTVKIVAKETDGGVGEPLGGIIRLRPRESVVLFSDPADTTWRVVTRFTA